VKNQLERILELKLLDPLYLDDQAENFPWTQEVKAGRIPRSLAQCKGVHVGQWKAEGLQKFSFPMADCIFIGKLADRNWKSNHLFPDLQNSTFIVAEHHGMIT